MATEPDAAELDSQREAARDLPYCPLISVITPVFNPPVTMLTAAIESVIAQSYSNWELCIVDAASMDPRVQELLHGYAARDPRIRVHSIQENLGISRNSNAAIAMARGEFIALLDHDDVLSAAALFEVANALNADGELDFIYTDKDQITEDGRHRFNPLFKPQWSPELALAANYMTHLCVIRTALIREIGGFDPETDGAQDWDLFLRIVERTDRVHRIPKVLYHWRQHAASVSSGIAAKPYALPAQRRCVEGYVRRRGIEATVDHDAVGYVRLNWPAKCRTHAAIIITSGGDHAALDRCVKSLAAQSTSGLVSTIIACSTENERMIRHVTSLADRSGFRVCLAPDGLAEPALRNYAASRVEADYFIFINEQLEVLNPDCLRELGEWAQIHEIGAVGPQVQTRLRQIANAGLALGLNGLVGELFRGALPGHYGLFGGTQWYRNVTALGAACMAVRRDVFQQLSGFNTSLRSDHSAIEFCLRLREHGYRMMCTPFARVVMHNNQCAGITAFDSSDPQDFRTRVDKHLTMGDPYFNPNLSTSEPVPEIRSGNGNSRETSTEIGQEPRSWTQSTQLWSLAIGRLMLRVTRSVKRRIVRRLTGIALRTRALGVRPLHWRRRAREAVRVLTGPTTREAWILANSLDFGFGDLQASREATGRYPSPLELRTVTWFLPEFQHAYYGGVLTILRLASHLEARHAIQNSFAILGQADRSQIAARIATAFPNLIEAPVYVLDSSEATRNLPPSDAAVATLWTTAYTLLKFNRVRRKFYMIQDCEPLFYPAGSTSGQAAETYRFGFYGICNTQPLREIYEREYGGVAESFVPAVDLSIFHPRVDAQPARRPATVFFYGRPGHPRNGFELGASALRIVKARLGDDARIVSAGDRWDPADFGLRGIVENLGLLSYEATAELYRNCDVGLTMMFTRHPSYLPLELMASGCLVVANQNNANRWLLQDGQTCLLSPASPTCLADTIERGLRNAGERAKITREALDYVRIYHANWDAQFEKIHAFMVHPRRDVVPLRQRRQPLAMPPSKAG